MRILSNKRFNELVDAKINLQREERSREYFKNEKEKLDKNLKEERATNLYLENDRKTLELYLKDREQIISKLQREVVSLRNSKNSNEKVKKQLRTKNQHLLEDILFLKSQKKGLEELTLKLQQEVDRLGRPITPYEAATLRRNFNKSPFLEKYEKEITLPDGMYFGKFKGCNTSIVIFNPDRSEFKRYSLIKKTMAQLKDEIQTDLKARSERGIDNVQS